MFLKLEVRWAGKREESTFRNEFSNESSELVSKRNDTDTTFPNGGAFPFPGTSREGAAATEMPLLTPSPAPLCFHSR